MTALLLQLPSTARPSRLAAYAKGLGADGLLLDDDARDHRTIDSSIAATWLSGSATATVITADTGRHAPYNLARRTLTAQRASGGHAGLLLRAGGLDPVTAHHSGDEPARPDASGHEEAGHLWTEYAEALRALWHSFPEDALIGDQETGVFARPGTLRPLDRLGREYRTAGPLNLPVDSAGPPSLLAEAALPGQTQTPRALASGHAVFTRLPLSTASAHADAVIVDAAGIRDAHDAAAEVLRHAALHARPVRPLIRITPQEPSFSLRSWTGGADDASRGGIHGFVLAATDDGADTRRLLSETAAGLRKLRVLPAPRPALRPPSLRALLDLPAWNPPRERQPS